MKRRKVSLFVIILAVCLPLVMGFGPLRQDDRLVQLSVNAGYDGRFRSDLWTPLLLNVSNDGPDIRGSLRVRSAASEGLNSAIYGTPIDLPSQSRKQVFIYASLRPFANDLIVELVSGDEVIEAVEVRVTGTRVSDLITATVTDSPGGAVDFSGLRMGGSSTYQATWSVENVPPLADALLALNVIVFSDVDSGRLSVEQRQAVEDWVLAGGHLIVTGGPNYRSTTEGLAGLLPLDVTGTTTLDDVSELAKYAGRYVEGEVEELAAEDIILATGDLRQTAQMLVAVDGEPVLTRRALGEGLVDFLGVDPNLAPLRDWGSIDALWAVAVTTSRQQPSWSNGVQDWSRADRVVQQAPGFDLPSATQMCGLLAAYILFIGPVNYVVLRALRRRELAWLTIPALVVTFSILAFTTGSSLRGTQATINRLSFVQVWPDSDRAQVDGLVGVLSARRTTYDLSVPEGMTLRSIPQDGNVGGLAPVFTSTLFEQGTMQVARDFLVDAGLVAGFATSGFIDDAPHLDAEVNLTFNVMGAGELRGSVRNTTGFVLRDAVVLYRTGAYPLGTLQPDDEAEFEAMIAPTTPSAPLSLFRGYDSFGGSSLVAPSSGIAGDLEVTVSDVLGRFSAENEIPTPFPGGAVNPTLLREGDRAFRQRWNFLSALAPDRDYSGGRGDRVFVVGWADESPLDLDLRGAGWIPEDVTVYVFEVPLTVDREPGQRVTVTPGFSTWFVTADATGPNLTPYEFGINGGERAAFRFTPLPSVQLGEVDRLQLTANLQVNSPTNAANVYLWNWRQEAWEQVEMSPEFHNTVEISEDVSQFVGPNNAVEVMIEPLTGTGFVIYERVDVTWIGAF